MARLPIVGSDGDAWGDVLNEYLGVAHQTDGTIDAADIGNTPAGDITATDVQDALNQLDTNKVDSGDVLSPDGATLEQSGATLRIRQPVTTYLDISEMAEPAAPSANTARLFVKDTGGKTQLLVRFPSGTSQVIATEP